MKTQKGKEVVVFEPLAECEKQLIEFRSKYKNVVFDLSDSKELTKAKKAKTEISAARAALERLKKSRVNDINDNYKRINDELVEMRDAIGDPIKKHNKAIAAAKKLIDDKIDTLKEIGNKYTPFNPPSESGLYIEQINLLEDIVIDDSYGNRMAEAVNLKHTIRESLTEWYEKAFQDEVDKADLERLRKKEAEKIAEPVVDAVNNVVEEAKQEELEHESDPVDESESCDDITDDCEHELTKPIEITQNGHSMECVGCGAQLNPPDDEIGQAGSETSTIIHPPGESVHNTYNDAIIASVKQNLALSFPHLTEKTINDLVTAIANDDIPNLKIVY